jgi:uncharacterized protein
VVSFQDLGLAFAGLVAGTIDSIAGGGGLITLPTLTSVLEPGPHAIGTNKIVGTLGALIAFLVYFKQHPLHPRRGLSFGAAVGVGSLLGSVASPYIPKVYFRYFLIAACPLVLWVVWNKKLFIQEVKDHLARPWFQIVWVGIAVGFYDGFFGPGGGTFMLIGLLWGAKLGLMEALLLSKLANTLSAGVSLVSYGAQGYVHVREGLVTAVGMTVGAFLGSTLVSKSASNKAEKVVRPVLLLVVVLLVAVQIRELLS